MRKMDLASAVLLLTAAVAVAQPPAYLDGNFAAGVVVDAASGVVLVAKNPHERRPPASMLKMMTELIVLERIEKGEFALTDTVTISECASQMGGSQVYLKEGERFTIEDLLRALAIHSANDAAAAVAEHVAGSLEAFIDLMNMRARELGMKDTVFHSVHGLPPGKPGRHARVCGNSTESDMTTAADMAILAREVIKHTKSLEWSSQPEAPFRGGTFTLHSPNNLLGNYRGLDGLKTGYTRPAGYCITATAVQNNARLIAVVMGCPSPRVRAAETTRLLSYGFNLLSEVTLVSAAGLPLVDKARVEGGKTREVDLVYGGALTVSVPKQKAKAVSLTLELSPSLKAPLVAGARVGRAIAVLDGREIGSVPVVTGTAVAKGTWFDRLFR